MATKTKTAAKVATAAKKGSNSGASSVFDLASNFGQAKVLSKDDLKSTDGGEYQAPTWNSQYSDRINSRLDAMENWNYDPLQDASYRALAKVYNQRGNTAAKDTMGQVAALNGGYGSSYAATAAAQQRSIYNQELASKIPELEQNAWGRNRDVLSALREADDTDYGRYRDTVADSQWKYGMDYQKYRDSVADSQWQSTFDWQKTMDTRNYKLDKSTTKWNNRMTKAQIQALKKNSKSGGGGGGGGRRSGGGGGGSYGGGGTSSSGSKAADAYKTANSKAQNGKKGTPNDPGAAPNKDYLEHLRKHGHK